MKMNEKMFDVMREAARLLKTDGPAAATSTIQRSLRGLMPADAPGAAADVSRPMRDINPAPSARKEKTASADGFVPDLLAGLRMPSPLGDMKFDLPGYKPQPGQDRRPDGASGGQFLARSFSNHAGTRDYKLYIPAGYDGQALPLVVMLHGCTQNPDDFAAGTRMNAIAEEKQCFVVYPAQAQSANGSKCWNWFNAVDQQRDLGEPSIIAGITREVIDSYRVDAQQVYIAGLSAGGAMAVIMGNTYPDLYAAVGIHSGLPYAAANDLPSALAAMRGGMGAGRARPAPATGANARLQAIPVIVFHGDSDHTVNARNGDQIIAQSMHAGQPAAQANVEQGRAPGGHAFTRTVHKDGGGQVLAEQWLVHGAGHAWFGGSSRGSYTDAKGPDASEEMMRFFTTRSQQARSVTMATEASQTAAGRRCNFG